MKKTTKILLATIIAIITLATTSKANYQIIYQSNASNYVKTNGNTFITNVRNMEANGQVMGLNENASDRNADLTSISSNKIDVHLIKNTEYGALVLLSASAEYGKQGSGTARYVGTGTTTGNVYGVYMQANGWNWVAGGVGAGSTQAYPTSINPKYVNRYSNTDTRLAGDALLGWHDGSISLGNNYGIVRGNSSVFSSSSYHSSNSLNYFGRASVVCGAGF